MNARCRLNAMVAFTGLIALAGCNGFLNVPTPSTEQACTSTAECDAGDLCIDNVCSFGNDNQCWIYNTAGECPTGETCVDGVCSRYATDWCDCEETEGCLDGVCVNLSEDNACSASLTNGACLSGSVCVAGTCVTIDTGNICSVNRVHGLCPSGSGCDDGHCVPISEDPCGPTNTDGLCEAGAVCDSSGECVLSPCSSSNTTGYCPDLGDYCDDGTCVTLPCSPENTTGPCEDPTTFCSTAGECIPKGSCAGDGDCDAGMYCSAANVCRTTGTCADNADCDQFSVCTDNTCVRDPSCTDDTYCPSGEHCLHEPSGTCAPVYACAYPDLDANDCSSGEYCSAAGECIATDQCLSDLDCGDSSRCASGPCTCGVTNVCLEPGECAADGDCAFAEACSTTSGCYAAEACDTQVTENGGDKPTCESGNCCDDTDRRCHLTGDNPRCVNVGRCVDNSDCPQGATCNTSDHTCTNGTVCANDDDCSSGFCSQLGVCISDECGTIEDCSGGKVCDGNFKCVFTDACGGQEFVATVVKPNMLILLDRSGSMNWNTSDGNYHELGTTACPTQDVKRWQTALAAIHTVVTDHDDDIRFGLSTYPSNNNCGGAFDCDVNCSNNCHNGCTSSAPPSGSNSSDNCEPGYVDVAVGRPVAEIDASLDANRPGGRTPTHRALSVIADDPEGYGLPATEDGRDNFILLITDGEPNCSGSLSCPSSCIKYNSNGSTSCSINCAVGVQLDRLRELPHPVKTFTVGFAFAKVNGNLNCNAVHGGTSLCDASVTASNCSSSTSACYYQADSPSALVTALDSITQQISGGCTLQLDQVPVQLSLLYVYVNGNEIQLDDPNGYTYDSETNRVQLQGNACVNVRDNHQTPKIIYGCPDGGS